MLRRERARWSATCLLELGGCREEGGAARNPVAFLRGRLRSNSTQQREPHSREERATQQRRHRALAATRELRSGSACGRRDRALRSRGVGAQSACQPGTSVRRREGTPVQIPVSCCLLRSPWPALAAAPRTTAGAAEKRAAKVRCLLSSKVTSDHRGAAAAPEKVLRQVALTQHARRLVAPQQRAGCVACRSRERLQLKARRRCFMRQWRSFDACHLRR